MTDIDRSVVEALRRGEHQAYKTVVDAMLGPVHGFLLRLCRDPDVAADLAQETFVAVWQSIDSFRGRSQFRTWVFGIAYHRFLRHRDKCSAEPIEFSELIEDEADARNAIDEAATRTEVREAVDGLPNLYREVVTLVHLDGLTYREASETLGISIGTVKSRMNVALRMLREALGEGCGR